MRLVSDRIIRRHPKFSDEAWLFSHVTSPTIAHNLSHQIKKIRTVRDV